jgi:putative membrane protein
MFEAMRVTRQLSMLCLVVVIAALSLTACSRGRTVEAAREDRQPTVSPAEQDFMMKTAQAHLSEIDMARLALQKSQNPDVKDYANMIESDHTSALEDLTDLMKDKSVSQPRNLNPETKMEIERLTALSGADFDREFGNMMVADHQKAVEMFRDQVSIAQNPDVKKYAEDLLPKLEMHLEKAQKLQSKLFGGGRK